MYNVIYYDGGDSAKRAMVETVLTSFSLSYKMIEKEELTQTIGHLFEGTTVATKEEKQPIIHIDLMMLQDMEDEKIQALSDALRAQNAHVERKAMLTKHNITWKFTDLLKEIEEEHTYFMKYDEIKQAILDFQTMKEESYTKDSWNCYQKAIVQAYALLQDRGDFQQLVMALQSIQQSLKNLQMMD